MKRTFMSATAAAALSVSSGFAANAQSGTDSDVDFVLDEIIVTTQKQEQSLIDVPINVSVADQSLIDLLSADDFEDLGNFVPGLQVQAQSLNAPSYSLRGVVSDGDTPRVAIFQNGVAIGNPGYATNLAIYDMERIEVVKGPQATLFGQGALVGGVNFIQNRASTAGNAGKLTVEAGDYESFRAEGFYNAAISETLALRIAGQFKTMDGYVPNIGNSPDKMGQDTTAIRGALHWRPIPTLTADIFFNYQDDDSTGTQFTSGFFPVNGRIDPFGPTAMNINDDQVRDKLGNDRDLRYVTANLELELNEAWTLTSLTDYRDLESQEAWDSDGALFNLLQFYFDQADTTFSQELRLNYDAGGRVSGFFGANYFDLDGESNLLFSTDEAYAQALFAPTIAGIAGLSVAQLEGFLGLAGVPGAENFDSFEDPLQFSALGALQGLTVPLFGEHLESSIQTEGRKTYDLFGDITFDVTDRLSLTGGLRFTQEELEATNTGRYLKSNPALGGVGNGVFLAVPTFLVDPRLLTTMASVSEDTDGDFTWRLNAAYRVNNDINTWIAYGRGRRPETLSTAGAGFDLIDAETLDNIEAGLFGRFLDDRVQLTSSVYYGEYTDFQTTRFDPNNGGFVTENSGNATQYGFEFDGQALLTENIRLLATYAYTFSEYDDEDDDGNPLQFAGNRFRITPENSFSLAADIEVPLGAGGSLSIVPSYIWKGDHFFEDDNGFDYVANDTGGFDRIPEMFPDGTLVDETQDAYGIANLRLGYDAADERWGAFVVGENLFDEEYLIDVGNTGGVFGLHTFIRGKPQMFKAGVYVSF